MAIRYLANGVRIEVKPANGRAFTLLELQSFVGGHIELVRLPGRRFMFVNEEGKLNGLEPNLEATKMITGLLTDIIVGDVVVCSAVEAGEG